MKKLNYLLLGLAGLTLASCSNDDLQAPADGTYQLTVNLPKDMATRAIGDQITADQTLSYTVFTYDGGVYVTEGTQDFGPGQTSTTINLPLLKGNGYRIAFFSQSTSSESVYEYDPETAVLTVNYDKMTYGDDVDADAYDCFSGKYEIAKVEGAISETITLTRPVAQINWGTNDLTSAAVKQAFGDIENIQTTLTATDVPTELNIITGEYIGEAGTVTFPATGLPSTDEAFPVDGYSYLAMQYVLPPANKTSDLTLSVTGQTTSADPIKIEVTNAPLQTNYRTNIYGGLLTDQANFQIDLSSSWGVPDNNMDLDGAEVELQENGTYYCTTPILPVNVTPQMMKDNNAGAVAISADGTPVYIQPTGTDINNAMQKYSEIYFAPNATINTSSHTLSVPQSGVTIHGNGATLQGGEHDFALASAYEDGSIVNLTINNLNGVKIWNAPTNACTVNVNLTNCTFTGSSRKDTGSLIMTRVGDNALSTINFNVQNCHVQNTQVAIHSTLPGKMVFYNCVFTEVGIPINMAKKLNGAKSNITVSHCLFDKCGIADTDTQNDAYNYAAPVRVVDNGGPADYTTLLVDNCTFTGTLSQWDILLWDYRTDKVRTSYPVDLTVKNCTPANPSVNTIDAPVTMGK